MNNSISTAFISFFRCLSIPALLGVGICFFCTGETPPGCVESPPGVAGWYKAEGNTVDASGNSPSGTLSNVVFSLGKVGQAFSFNGSNSVVEVTDEPSLRLTNQLSIEFWVKRQRILANKAEFILEKGGDWTRRDQNYGVALHIPEREGVLHFLSAGGWWGAGSVLDNEWHHCAIVARHGESAPIIYIDGVARPVRFHEGSPTINLKNSARPLHIGAQIDPVSGWNYYGKTIIDELTLYDRMLTADEVRAIYLAGSAGKCPGTTPPPQLVNGRAAGDGTERTLTGLFNVKTILIASAVVALAVLAVYYYRK